MPCDHELGCAGGRSDERVKIRCGGSSAKEPTGLGARFRAGRPPSAWTQLPQGAPELELAEELRMAIVEWIERPGRWCRRVRSECAGADEGGTFSQPSIVWSS